MDLAGLLTEQRNPHSEDLDALPTEQMLAVFNREDKQVAEAVEKELPNIARAVDAIASAMSSGGRLFYIGAGTSGRLGVLDASECPPTFGVPYGMVAGIIAGGEPALARATEASEDNPEAGAGDLKAAGFTARDVLCGIAASGRTPYVLGAVELANQMGAVTVGISCSPQSALSRAVRIPIEPLPGPEVISGSTRLKAGTATKLVLNMLSSGAMVRLGYVYSNLMVNVQPRNEKLVDRAQRIIRLVAGVDAAESARLLEMSGRNVRVAIVMGKLRISRAEAETRLERAGGRVRAALEA
ncbi:MAG: N-acetylmuramic acid 6-phosphate etherase [Bryobacterales bacterium]|nr:N-acetylmuramic acid 6-phosphate etherase [Bryobacterales bacterium]